jgi:branched-chain amino acid transport system substrate-binding protein
MSVVKMRTCGTCIIAVAALGLAACGESSSSSTSSGSKSGESGSTASAGPIDASKCSGTNTTQGVTSSEIKLGESLPESGPLAVVGQERYGMQAYFDYLNAHGGVKGRKLVLTALDDQYNPAQTVKNVQQLVSQNGVFAFAGLVGTAPNVAVAPILDQQCIPNLYAVTSAPVLASHPWTVIGQASNVVEPSVALAQIEKAVPHAKIGIVYQNDDLGTGFLNAWKKAIVGSDATIVATAPFEITGTNLTNQVTSVAAKGANVLYFGSAGGATCVQLLSAAAGKFKEVWLSAGCGIASLIRLAPPAGQKNVYVPETFKDPQLPAFKNDPAAQLFLSSMKQYQPKGDPTSIIAVQGWSIGAVVAAILARSPQLNRVSVMNTARTIDLANPGLYLNGIHFKLTPSDPYAVEAFQIYKWDPASQQLVAQGPPNTSFEGKSPALTG